jgi:hypothetical protein
MITIRDVRPLDCQISKLVVEGQPVSSSKGVSISQVLEIYKRLAEHDLEAVGNDDIAADASWGASGKE